MVVFIFHVFDWLLQRVPLITIHPTFLVLLTLIPELLDWRDLSLRLDLCRNCSEENSHLGFNVIAAISVIPTRAAIITKEMKNWFDWVSSWSRFTVRFRTYVRDSAGMKLQLPMVLRTLAHSTNSSTHFSSSAILTPMKVVDSPSIDHLTTTSNSTTTRMRLHHHHLLPVHILLLRLQIPLHLRTLLLHRLHLHFQHQRSQFRPTSSAEFSIWFIYLGQLIDSFEIDSNSCSQAENDLDSKAHFQSLQELLHLKHY